MTDRRQLSNDFKRYIVGYYLYNRNFMCATSEMKIEHGVADVVAISNEGVVYEIEVKVDWADFRSESKSISRILRWAPLLDTYHKGKYTKHWIYLRGAEEYIMQDPQRFLFDDDNAASWLLPHLFYYCVPDNLIERCVEALKGTPYGVMNSYGDIKKQAKRLHKNEIPFGFYKKMMRKMSRVNHELKK